MQSVTNRPTDRQTRLKIAAVSYSFWISHSFSAAHTRMWRPKVWRSGLQRPTWRDRGGKQIACSDQVHRYHNLHDLDDTQIFHENVYISNIHMIIIKIEIPNTGVQHFAVPHWWSMGRVGAMGRMPRRKAGQWDFWMRPFISIRGASDRRSVFLMEVSFFSCFFRSLASLIRPLPTHTRLA